MSNNELDLFVVDDVSCSLSPFALAITIIDGVSYVFGIKFLALDIVIAVDAVVQFAVVAALALLLPFCLL